MYAVAIALKEEKFTAVPELLQDFYYVSPHDSSPPMKPYTAYRKYLNSIDGTRNQRLKLRRHSLHADMLKQRAEVSQYIDFEHVMQADFFLFIYSFLHSTDDYFDNWFPVTTLYATDRGAPFEVFARSQSSSYFKKMKVALGIEDKAPLVELCDKFSRRESHTPPGILGALNLPALPQSKQLQRNLEEL
ncbi:hypothetical protein [Dethiosulfatarculus sandiegensis]|nr:hypothetical protein [Dethiosulfatarculus sandiegensis]